MRYFHLFVEDYPCISSVHEKHASGYHKNRGLHHCLTFFLVAFYPLVAFLITYLIQDLMIRFYHLINTFLNYFWLYCQILRLCHIELSCFVSYFAQDARLRLSCPSFFEPQAAAYLRKNKMIHNSNPVPLYFFGLCRPLLTDQLHF